MISDSESNEWPGHNLREELENQVGDVELTPEQLRVRSLRHARRFLEAVDSYACRDPWAVIRSVAFALFLVGFVLALSRPY